MLKLADNANSEGKCFPSMGDICKSTKLSESTVRRCLSDLEKGSYLTVIKGVGRGHNSQYQLHKKVSEEKVSERKVSERKVSTGPIKGVNLTLKGVNLTEPPHPLNRVTVINHQEPSGAFALTASPIVQGLPDWLNADLWQGFVEMRRKMPRVPFTDRAKTGILADLDRLRGWGIDPNQRLDKATKHGWRGVLFDSDGPQQKTQPPATKPKTAYELATEAQLEERRQAMRAAGVQ